MSNPYLVCSERELRALPTQWLLAERWEKAGSLLSDLNFAEAKTGQVSIDELLQDLTTALRLIPQNNSCLEKLNSIYRMLDGQAHGLRNWNSQIEPAFFLQQIRNQVFAQNIDQWQQQAEAELLIRKKPHLLERVPIQSDPIELRTLTGHNDGVNSVAISADGQLVISASEDQTLKVWDVATGRELRTLNGHTRAVKAVAISADGQLAISASRDKTVKVWDVQTGSELRTLTGHKDGVDLVAMSANGHIAISASSEKLIKVWNLETGAELHTFIGHQESITSIAISADGRLGVSASWDNILKVWDLNTGHELRTFPNYTGNNKFALSTDGRQIITSNYIVWNVETGRELYRLVEFGLGHIALNKDIGLNSDGSLAIFVLDDALSVWDIINVRHLRTLKRHSADITEVALSADGRIAISASSDGTLKVWDIRTIIESKQPKPDSGEKRMLANLVLSKLVEKQKPSKPHPEKVTTVVLSADGRLAVTVSKDGTVIKLWNTVMGRDLLSLRGHNLWMCDIALSSNGRVAVSISNNIYGRDITVWRISTKLNMRFATARQLGTLIGHSKGVNDVSLSADGRLAISTSLDETIKVWDVTSKRELRTIKTGEGGHHHIDLSADGRLAISAPDGKILYIWDVNTGHQLHVLNGHSLNIKSVAMSKDGRLAISASSDQTLKVWQVATGKELHTLRGHNGGVSDVALSPDGLLAISVSSDNTVKTWDLATGACIATLLADASLECCAISDNKKTIIVGDALGNVHFLELAGTDEVFY